MIAPTQATTYGSTMWITAGELRAYGVTVPVDVPDDAVANRIPYEWLRAEGATGLRIESDGKGNMTDICFAVVLPGKITDTALE